MNYSSSVASQQRRRIADQDWTLREEETAFPKHPRASRFDADASLSAVILNHMRWYVAPSGRWVRQKPRAPKAPPEDPRRRHQLERSRAKQRRFEERLAKLVDLRICGLCRYAFVSRSGSNICSECIFRKGSLPFLNMRRKPSIRRTMILIKRENPSWISRHTMTPAIPLPGPRSVWVDLAVQRTYAAIERSQRDGIFHVHRMPHLIGLPAYGNEIFRGFKCGRPPRAKTSIESSNRVVPHPPQEVRLTRAINWHFVLPPQSRTRS
jgi:hypothetical protein